MDKINETISEQRRSEISERVVSIQSRNTPITLRSKKKTADKEAGKIYIYHQDGTTTEGKQGCNSSSSAHIAPFYLVAIVRSMVSHVCMKTCCRDIVGLSDEYEHTFFRFSEIVIEIFL